MDEGMINDLLPLVPAVEKTTGLRRSEVQISRWCTKGCQGVVLQSTFLGSKRLTRIKWVQQFMDETAAAKMAKHQAASKATS
jgi:hypothetical protein